jgi:hypothetical protein
VGRKLNRTRKLLAYAKIVNLLGDNTVTAKKSTQSSIDVVKVFGLEINLEKTNYMLVSDHQNSGRNQETRIANRQFENMSQLKYLRATVTDGNLS